MMRRELSKIPWRARSPQMRRRSRRKRRALSGHRVHKFFFHSLQAMLLIFLFLSLSIFQQNVSETRLKLLLSNYVVSSSPFVLLNPPYLLTDSGKACALKKYFLNNEYRSPLLEEDPSGKRGTLEGFPVAHMFCGYHKSHYLILF